MRLGRIVLTLAVAVAGSSAAPESAGGTAGTLAELAARQGIRFGATAEPAEVEPGPYADVLAGQFSSRAATR